MVVVRPMRGVIKRHFSEDNYFFHFVLNKSIFLEFFVCFVFFVVSSLRLTLMIDEVLR